MSIFNRLFSTFLNPLLFVAAGISKYCVHCPPPLPPQPFFRWAANWDAVFAPRFCSSSSEFLNGEGTLLSGGVYFPWGRKGFEKEIEEESVRTFLFDCRYLKLIIKLIGIFRSN